MGPGQDPYGHRDDVPHFDRGAHRRTHEHTTERRAAAPRQGPRLEPESDPVSGFLVIAAILALSILSPVVLLRSWRGSGAEQADETRQKASNAKAGA
jgi:hypothetical protein